ncbi:MAG: cupin domain-containing protein [Synergistaceae bacterium]|nr:cupin domain-containing protein [Synergistaceae bacterium]
MRGNVFHIEAEARGEGEFLQTLWAGRDVRVERIVSSGQVSPPGFWYDQDEDEWAALLQGRAELEYEDGSQASLTRGDWLLIPAGRRHRVTFTSKEPLCVWLAVFARQ